MVSKRNVQIIIDSVRDAIDKECWIPALPTAPTLPDILGQVAYPEKATVGGRRKCAEQHEAWFAEHIEPRCADVLGWYEDGSAKTLISRLSVVG